MSVDIAIELKFVKFGCEMVGDHHHHHHHQPDSSFFLGVFPMAVIQASDLDDDSINAKRVMVNCQSLTFPKIWIY